MAAYTTAWFLTHVTCRLTAKNRDQLRNLIRSVIEYGLPFSQKIFYAPLPAGRGGTCFPCLRATPLGLDYGEKSIRAGAERWRLDKAGTLASAAVIATRG